MFQIHNNNVRCFIVSVTEFEQVFANSDVLHVFKVDNNDKKAVLSAHIYLSKVNNKNTRKRCEVSSNLTIKTPELCH